MKTTLFIFSIMVAIPGYGSMELKRDCTRHHCNEQSFSLLSGRALMSGIIIKEEGERDELFRLAWTSGYTSGGGTPFKNSKDHNERRDEMRNSVE